MSRIQPRALSNSELIRYAALEMDAITGLPYEWQLELLRRFTALAPINEPTIKNAAQLELFPDSE